MRGVVCSGKFLLLIVVIIISSCLSFKRLWLLVLHLLLGCCVLLGISCRVLNIHIDVDFVFLFI